MTRNIDSALPLAASNVRYGPQSNAPSVEFWGGVLGIVQLRTLKPSMRHTDSCQPVQPTWQICQSYFVDRDADDLSSSLLKNCHPVVQGCELDDLRKEARS